MHETELWITKLFNDHLAGIGNAALSAVGMHAEARPWANFVVMEILVALIIVVLFASVYPARRAAKYDPVEVIRGAH